MSNPPLASLPVLIVDDDPLTVQSVTWLLNANKIKDTIALSDSNEVIPLLRKQKIAAILLDHQMPVLSGDELLILIKKEFPEIPVIMVSGDDEPDLVAQCMQSGAFEFLVKPVEKDLLIATITKAIQHKDSNG